MNDVHVTLREMLPVDGQQMEFPFSWNNMVMYYNTAVFEEVGLEPPANGWNWDDFLEACWRSPACRVAPTTGSPIPSGVAACSAWRLGTSTTTHRR